MLIAHSITVEQIDALLPQTQCGLCEYSGCKPYAEAIVNQKAPINRCLPGGVRVLKKLADSMQQDASVYIAEMEQKAKPPLTAIIREAECIGCTKCIQACPVDAIIGAAKQMHSIITDRCTGCELCIAPCPVDCIDMLPVLEPSEIELQQHADAARQHFYLRQARLAKTDATKPVHEIIEKNNAAQIQAEIQAAVARTKAKKYNPDILK